MKKVIALVALMVSFMFATNAAAQIKFGVKGGLNVTNMTFTRDVFDASNKTGFFIGPMVKVSLPLGFSVDAAALYDQRSAKVEYMYAEVKKIDDGDFEYGEVEQPHESDAAAGTVNVKQKAIVIPVNLRYAVGLGSMANIFVFAGPQWGFNVGDKDYNTNTHNIYHFKDSNFSVNVGLGTTLLKHLQLSANYNIACGKTADVTVGKIISSTGDSIIKSKSRNNSWQIALGYWF